MPKLSPVQSALTPKHFIDLWLAIHGGDPAPDPVGVIVAGAHVLQELIQLETKEAAGLRSQVVQVMQTGLSSIS